MESPVSLHAAAIHHGGARIACLVTKTHGGGVRVSGRNGNRECVPEQRSTSLAGADWLRDRPLYRITSPLAICAAS